MGRKEKTLNSVFEAVCTNQGLAINRVRGFSSPNMAIEGNQEISAQFLETGGLWGMWLGCFNDFRG